VVWRESSAGNFQFLLRNSRSTTSPLHHITFGGDSSAWRILHSDSSLLWGRGSSVHTWTWGMPLLQPISISSPCPVHVLLHGASYIYSRICGVCQEWVRMLISRQVCLQRRLLGVLQVSFEDVIIEQAWIRREICILPVRKVVFRGVFVLRLVSNITSARVRLSNDQRPRLAFGCASLSFTSHSVSPRG